MAYAATKSVVAHAEKSGFAALVARVQDALSRRAVYTRTLRELQSLSERDLNDLNIHASQIKELAREAAYGR